MSFTVQEFTTSAYKGPTGHVLKMLICAECMVKVGSGIDEPRHKGMNILACLDVEPLDDSPACHCCESTKPNRRFAAIAMNPVWRSPS